MNARTAVELARGLTRSRWNAASLGLLAVLYLAALFAPALSVNPPDEILRDSSGAILSAHPPMGLVLDRQGLGYMTSRREQDPVTFAVKFVPIERRSARFLADGRLLDAPGLVLLGTDRLGRDLLSRILHGARVSLTVGIVGVAVSLTIGSLIGGLAGAVGGRVDHLLMRLAEMLMMVPGIYLLLTLAAVLPKDLSSTARYFLIIIVLSSIGWASLARVVRGMVLSLRERDFVQASIAAGATRWHVLWRHILPNCASYLIVAATIQIPNYILGESGLSLLGLGIQEPDASWGNLLVDAKSGATLALSPWLLAPGFFIAAAIVAFNVLGDALRDELDPAARKLLS